MVICIELDRKTFLFAIWSRYGLFHRPFSSKWQHGFGINPDFLFIMLLCLLSDSNYSFFEFNPNFSRECIFWQKKRTYSQTNEHRMSNLLTFLKITWFNPSGALSIFGLLILTFAFYFAHAHAVALQNFSFLMLTFGAAIQMSFLWKSLNKTEDISYRCNFTFEMDFYLVHVVNPPIGLLWMEVMNFVILLKYFLAKVVVTLDRLHM